MILTYEDFFPQTSLAQMIIFHILLFYLVQGICNFINKYISKKETNFTNLPVTYKNQMGFFKFISMLHVPMILLESYFFIEALFQLLIYKIQMQWKILVFIFLFIMTDILSIKHFFFLFPLIIVVGFFDYFLLSAFTGSIACGRI